MTTHAFCAMAKPRAVVFRGVTIRKARSGWAILWPTQPTSFSPNLIAAKALVADRLKRKCKI